MRFLTSSVAIWDVVRVRTCSRGHEHEVLQGASSKGSRTRLAARWADFLDDLIVKAVEQQVDLDMDTHMQAYPAELGEEWKAANAKRLGL